MDWSNDGRFLAGGGHHDGIVVWDTSSGEIVRFIRPQEEGFEPWDSGFSPDGKRLLMSRAMWPDDSWVDVYSTETWELERSVQIDPETADKTLGLVGWSTDGSTLYGRGGAESGSGSETLVWLDAETLEKQGPVVRLHDDAVMDDALSPEGTRLATASASGEVRVWDLQERSLVHEFQLDDIFAGQLLAGVDWTDEANFVVVTETGMLAKFTTDADELAGRVRASLTRSFTEGECARYEIDPCPSLEEIRGS